MLALRPSWPTRGIDMDTDMDTGAERMTSLPDGFGAISPTGQQQRQLGIVSEVQLGVRFPRALVARIDAYLAFAAKHHQVVGLTRSDVIRDMVESGLTAAGFTEDGRRPRIPRQYVPQVPWHLLPAKGNQPEVPTAQGPEPVRTPGYMTYKALPLSVKRGGVDARGIPLPPEIPVTLTDAPARAAPSFATVDPMTGRLVMVPEAVPDGRTWQQRAKDIYDARNLAEWHREESETARPTGSSAGRNVRSKGHADDD